MNQSVIQPDLSHHLATHSVVLGYNIADNCPIECDATAFQAILRIEGEPQTGRTQYLISLIQQLLDANHGIVFGSVDNATFIPNIVASISTAREADVVIFNADGYRCGNEQYFTPINTFPLLRSLITQHPTILGRLFQVPHDDHDLYLNILKISIDTLAATLRDATIHDVIRLITDEAYRTVLLQQCPIPTLITFWNTSFVRFMQTNTARLQAWQHTLAHSNTTPASHAVMSVPFTTWNTTLNTGVPLLGFDLHQQSIDDPISQVFAVFLAQLCDGRMAKTDQPLQPATLAIDNAHRFFAQFPSISGHFLDHANQAMLGLIFVSDIAANIPVQLHPLYYKLTTLAEMHVATAINRSWNAYSGSRQPFQLRHHIPSGIIQSLLHGMAIKADVVGLHNVLQYPTDDALLGISLRDQQYLSTMPPVILPKTFAAHHEETDWQAIQSPPSPRTASVDRIIERFALITPHERAIALSQMPVVLFHQYCQRTQHHRLARWQAIRDNPHLIPDQITRIYTLNALRSMCPESELMAWHLRVNRPVDLHNDGAKNSRFLFWKRQ